MKKKIYTKINRKRLTECLNLVGWSLRNCGCNYYVLVNPYGNKSDIRTSPCENEDEPIYELRVGEYNLFGKTEPSFVHVGFCSFVLKGCILEVNYSNDVPDFISITSKKVKDCNQPSFICFSKKLGSPPTP